MVPRVGIEPTTLGLEVLCSILLSYRGITLQYTLFFLGFADWSEVGVLEAGGVFESVAERAVNEDVEEPNKSDE